MCGARIGITLLLLLKECFRITENYNSKLPIAICIYSSYGNTISRRGTQESITSHLRAHSPNTPSVPPEIGRATCMRDVLVLPALLVSVCVQCDCGWRMKDSIASFCLV